MSLRRLARIVPALAWAAMTLVTSTSLGSDGRTSGYVLPFLEDDEAA